MALWVLGPDCPCRKGAYVCSCVEESNGCTGVGVALVTNVYILQCSQSGGGVPPTISARRGGRDDAPSFFLRRLATKFPSNTIPNRYTHGGGGGEGRGLARTRTSAPPQWWASLPNRPRSRSIPDGPTDDHRQSSDDYSICLYPASNQLLLLGKIPSDLWKHWILCILQFAPWAVIFNSYNLIYLFIYLNFTGSKVDFPPSIIFILQTLHGQKMWFHFATSKICDQNLNILIFFFLPGGNIGCGSGVGREHLGARGVFFWISRINTPS